MPKVDHHIHFDEIFGGIKNHVERHKMAYSFGAGIVVAGFTSLIMRSTVALGGAGGSTALGGVANTASLIFRSPQTVFITTVIDREGRGHPGWPVKNLDFNRIFFSQREAANAFGIPEGRLSGHLKGVYPDVDGLHFERVNLVPTA